MNSIIDKAEYNSLIIGTRKSDGWVNLTQMCCANAKRLDNWLRLKQTQEYLNYLRCEVVNSDVVETIEGRHGGTWGHPLLAINLARWIGPNFAIWCDANIFVLINDGVIKLENDPLQRMNEILEDYAELNRLMFGDERFHGIEQYSDWSL